MPRYLALRLEGPLQSWGDVAIDSVRPTRHFPSRSALAGLLASALGWTYADGEVTTALQDALHYAVLELRMPTLLVDYQTTDLGRDAIGWTRWGIEGRGGSVADGTQITWKHYLANGAFLVTLTLDERAPVTLDALAVAVRHPARPLYLGRRSCPPASPLYAGMVEATTSYDALVAAVTVLRQDPAYSNMVHTARCWYPVGDGPLQDAETEQDRGLTFEIWDRRDYTSQRFIGSRRLVQGALPLGPTV